MTSGGIGFRGAVNDRYICRNGYWRYSNSNSDSFIFSVANKMTIKLDKVRDFIESVKVLVAAFEKLDHWVTETTIGESVKQALKEVEGE